MVRVTPGSSFKLRQLADVVEEITGLFPPPEETSGINICDKEVGTLPKPQLFTLFQSVDSDPTQVLQLIVLSIPPSNMVQPNKLIILDLALDETKSG